MDLPRPLTKFSCFQAFLALLSIQVPSLAVAQSLPDGVQALSAIDERLPSTELASLAPLFDQASLIGLGESAHGSAGYARAQLRLVQELVESHGYRLLLMETLTDDRRLDDYLRTCQGNLKELTYRNSWYDHHEERASLYRWLCRYNQSHAGDPVRLRAFDAQMPWRDAPVARGFLERYAPDLAAAWMGPIESQCFGAGKTDQLDWAFSDEARGYQAAKGLDPARHSACMTALDSVQRELKARETHFSSTALAQEYGDAWHALERVRSWELKSLYIMDPSNLVAALKLREAVMGPSLLWQWRGASSTPPKAIVIAHNLHLTKTAIPPTESAADGWTGIESLGLQLRRAMGDRYRNIALSGYEVGGLFKARFPLPSSDRSLDFQLQKLARPYLLVDPSAPWIAAQGDWLLQEETFQNGRLFRLPDAFDRVLFLSSSEAAVFLGAP